MMFEIVDEGSRETYRGEQQCVGTSLPLELSTATSV